MYRALLPATCPACGEDVPRAAGLRCPLCLIPFFGLKPGQARPRPARPLRAAMDRELRKGSAHDQG